MVDRILVVDNESKNISLLRQVFSTAGFAVMSANRSDRALQLIAEECFSLVITDSTLQAESDGFDLIRRMREFSEVPVIVLTKNVDSEPVLHAYELGADDVMAKPFDPRILLAKIRALLKRWNKTVSTPEIIQCGNLCINQMSRQVTVADVPVYLTETEYNLLLELAKHPDQVMLHEQLLESVWGPEYRHEMDYLRSYVHILRKKLEANTPRGTLIVSLSGIGYKLNSNSPENNG